MRPIPGTITDPAATRSLFADGTPPLNEEYIRAYGPEQHPEPVERTDAVHLSRRESAWLIEAALRHAKSQGTPDYAEGVILKLWGAFKGVYEERD